MGCIRGDLQLLDTSSYETPLLSTLVLVLVGISVADMALLWATLLITGGAPIAARASFSKK
jgi:hypothetical protein